MDIFVVKIITDNNNFNDGGKFQTAFHLIFNIVFVHHFIYY